MFLFGAVTGDIQAETRHMCAHLLPYRIRAFHSAVPTSAGQSECSRAATAGANCSGLHAPRHPKVNIPAWVGFV